MESLMNKRTNLKRRITTLQKSVETPTTPLTSVAATILLEQVNKLMEQNNDLTDEITLELGDDDDQHEEVRATQQVRLLNMKMTLHDVIHPTASSSSSSSSSSSHRDDSTSGSQDNPTATAPSKVRLPQLSLPSFNGNRQDWTSFHDLFKSAIDGDKGLTDSQKLQYLKLSLSGEPALLIKSFAITNTNYKEAWETLIARYEDQREIIKANFDRILNQGFVNVENPAALQKYADTTRECMRAIINTGVDYEQAYNLLLVQLCTKHMDSEIRVQWERTIEDDTLPTMDGFLKSLHRQAKINSASKCTDTKRSQKPEGKRKEAVVHHGAAASVPKPSIFSCPYCGEDHGIFKCPTFLALSIPDRWEAVKRKRLCNNCLSGRHRIETCTSGNCRTCQKKHSTLLHRATPAPATTPAEPPTLVSHLHPHPPNTQVLLSTALIRVKDNRGEYRLCRALLDNGSQASFITSKCATLLGLRRLKVNVPLTGLAEINAGKATEIATLNFTSCHNFDPSFNVQALILKHVTCELPTSPVQPEAWPHLHGSELADPHYDDIGKIDILLGADIFLSLLETGKIDGPPGAPVAVKTVLGWIVGGRTCNANTTPPPLIAYHVQCDLNTQLQRLWELEEFPKAKPLSSEEKACVQHFATTHSRRDDGRYVVRLPFKSDARPLGASRDSAVRRLKSLERRFSNHPLHREKHSQVLEEYLTLQQMELVPDHDIDSANYYMPHHAVIRDESTTTNYRVVFDASADSSSGVSLNEILMVGPKLQDDMVTILIRFRKHKIVLIADITKMYRQIEMHENDVNFQRIVWRNSVSEPMRDYRMLTATFGTSAAPFLAIMSIQQLAKDEEESFPVASKVLSKDFYVDDLMSGAATEEEAIDLQRDLTNLLARGRFELRKWASNSSAVLAQIPESLKKVDSPLQIDTDDGMKTLGLQWHPATDQFSFKVTMSDDATVTKRTILSDVAKVFDPLGWLSPVTVRSKMLIQQLWRAGLAWDDAVQSDLKEVWSRYREQLPNIENIRIPRRVTQDFAMRQQLHGFCDASEQAYAAVVFLRSVDGNGKVTTTMIAAKSKVAPVKQVSLPRLELCGAVLLVRLMEQIRDSLNMQIDEIFGWTDSTIVLAWLASPPQRWKTVVANRVSEIQDVIPTSAWRHVRSEDNPADCASRGITPTELIHHKLWWEGPSWLSSTDVTPDQEDLTNMAVPEERTTIKAHQVITPPSVLDKISRLSSLLRITVYCIRFVTNSRKQRIDRLYEGKIVRPPTADEMDKALLRWVRLVQQDEFKDDINLP